MEKKQQWKKRVEIVEYFYSCLINKFSNQEIKTLAFEKYNFDANQLEVIEYYANNKKEVEKLISSNLSKDWTFERLPMVEKAILIQSICEFKSLKKEKSIIIDQALVTTKHYCDVESTKYINAILDKVL